MSTGNWNFPYLKLSYSILFMACMWSNSQYEIEGILYWQHYTQTHPLRKRMPNRRTPFEKAGSVKFMTVFMAYTWVGSVPLQKCIIRGFLFATKYFVGDLKSEISVIIKSSCFDYLFLIVYFGVHIVMTQITCSKVILNVMYCT